MVCFITKLDIAQPTVWDVFYGLLRPLVIFLTLLTLQLVHFHQDILPLHASKTTECLFSKPVWWLLNATVVQASFHLEKCPRTRQCQLHLHSQTVPMQHWLKCPVLVMLPESKHHKIAQLDGHGGIAQSRIHDLLDISGPQTWSHLGQGSLRSLGSLFHWRLKTCWWFSGLYNVTH